MIVAFSSLFHLVIYLLIYPFCKGEIKSVPSGDFIDKIHEEWFGNYALLERHHGYIQW